MLSARYELAHALWKGQEIDAAADHTQRLIDECVRIVGQQLVATADPLDRGGPSDDRILNTEREIAWNAENCVDADRTQASQRVFDDGLRHGDLLDEFANVGG